MRGLFVDTSAWIAVTDGSDQFHAEAAAFYRRALVDYQKLVTTGLVLAETFALLRRGLSTDHVLHWLDRILTSPRVEVVYEDRGVVDRARTLLARYADQAFSLTDGVSFVVMRDQKVREAFAFDQHFRTVGFTLVPSPKR